MSNNGNAYRISVLGLGWLISMSPEYSSEYSRMRVRGGHVSDGRDDDKG